MWARFVFICVYILACQASTATNADVCTSSTDCERTVRTPSLVQRLVQSSKLATMDSTEDLDDTQGHARPGTVLAQVREHTAKVIAGEVPIARGGFEAKHVEDGLLELANKVVQGKEKISNTTRTVLASLLTEMDSVISGCTTNHLEDQGEVNRARDAIIACSTATTTLHTQANGIDDLASTVSQDRNTHATCRGAEKILKADMTTKCTDWETYRTGLDMPSCTTCGSSGVGGFNNADMVCMRSLASWVSTANTTMTSKKNLCEEATSEHSTKVSSCDTAQGAFESAFCSYKVALSRACSGQETCRNTAMAARTTTHAAVQTAEAATQAEYVSAKHVQCFIRVLNATESQQASMLSSCVAETHNTSHLDITYYAVPAAATCDETPIATAPCDAVWLTTEYEGGAWYADAPPQTCAPCATTTVTTSTTTAPSPGGVIEYLIVGGGGGGASGGGGAGGVLHGSGLESEQTISILVGAGGSSGTGYGGAGKGGDSSIGSNPDHIAHGGGKGGSHTSKENAGEGGSGGGGGYDSPSITRTSGVSGQGNGGGRSDRGGYGAGAGGGGAGEPGHDAPQQHYGGPGGKGKESSISCTSTWYGGGGGGGVNNNNNRDDDPLSGGRGGQGGGGNGSTAGFGTSDRFTGSSGVDGLGGGGGGTDPESTVAGKGGSGIVIVRYPGGPRFTGGTVSSCHGDTVHTFATVGQHTLQAV